MPKIFISYRRNDSAMLATLMQVKLQAFEIDAFVDTRSMDGGGLFPNRLRRAIEEADVFVCLLGASTLDSAWVQEEIEHAYQNKKVLIPVFQERYIAPNPIPDMGAIHTLLQSDGIHVFDVKNVYIDAAMSDLATMINESHLNQPPIKPTPPRPDSAIMPDPFEWIHIPAGNVTLEEGGYLLEGGQTFTVDDFFIAQYPITNAQYHIFANEKENNHRWTKQNKFNEDLQPVVGVSWDDAVEYCQWLSQKLGYEVTLPTEQQWQRAAQGNDGREYPWGNDADKDNANTDGKVGKTSLVTQYPQGISPFGVMDMSGNAWEWCLTAWENGSSRLDITNVQRILRGGSWLFNIQYARVANRFRFNPHSRNDSYGFRICVVNYDSIE